jgi:Flp pilus assembly protein TadD
MAESMYRNFGKDYLSRISELVAENIEIEMAKWPGTTRSATSKEFAGSVVAEISPSLSEAGVRVVGYRMDVWDIRPVEREAVTASATPEPLRKVIFIGVDGGDWDIITPLIDQGYLPNFKKIVDGGSTGRLRSIEPLLSPLIWTSIATGKLPEDHGILNFTVVDPETGKRVPITRMYRRVDALWNILGDFDRTVSVIGWLATYPAEEINGVMVTDRVGYLAYADSGDDEIKPGSIFPPERVGELSRFVVRSKDVPYDDFRRLLHIDRATFDGEKAVAFDPARPINNMIMLYASTLTYGNIAKYLLTHDAPDFLGVYFELVDAAGHLFMNYAPPRQDWVDEDEYETYKDAMLQTYRYQDRIIGEFIDMCDAQTVLVIASDHGFKSGKMRLRLGGEIGGGHAALWHQLHGIVGLYGSGIRAGHTIEGATVLDLAPTFLSLQGLPRAADMPGRILTDAFEDSLAGRLNSEIVATLERTRKKGTTPDITEAAADEETLKKLEALGYITRENPDAFNNLGQRYQEQGEYEKAIVEFKKALAINPNFPSALNNIGVCYGRLERYSLAEESFKRALALKPDDVYAMNNLAIMYIRIGKPQKAVEFAEMAVRVEPNYANGHLTLGSALATLGELERAEREFERALELDPGNREIEGNLRRVRAERQSTSGNP